MADANKVNYKNPKEIIIRNQSGAHRIRNSNYDPNKCERCGKKHGWFQWTCKKEDLK